MDGDANPSVGLLLEGIVVEERDEVAGRPKPAQSSIGLCDQDSGIRQSRRKILTEVRPTNHAYMYFSFPLEIT